MMLVRAFMYEDAGQWDAFCDDAYAATFLHTRRFLSYHGDRFLDRSLIVENDGRWLGIFPAAQHPCDEACIVSHPGITYGGLLHAGRLSGQSMIEAMECVRSHYRNLGYKQLIYKVVPDIYHRAPAQDDLYALFRLGAQRIRCDLSCTIDLANRRPPSERRRRGWKKANKVVTLSNDPTMLGELWTVIAQNLAREHDAQPVHSLDELAFLMNSFPEQICIRYAMVEGRVEAGVLLFNTAAAWHAQYIAASERAYEVSALDAVFESAIEAARLASVRYFDFGISTEDGGRILNGGLYRFKSEFGGGGTVHEFYKLDLQK
jgi:hypothetical protein